MRNERTFVQPRMQSKSASFMSRSIAAPPELLLPLDALLAPPPLPPPSPPPPQATSAAPMTRSHDDEKNPRRTSFIPTSRQQGARSRRVRDLLPDPLSRHNARGLAP